MTLTHGYLAQLCGMAYGRHTFRDEDVEVYHYRAGDSDIFAITGTELNTAKDFFKKRGWKDVVRDFLFWPSSRGGIQGHFGFVDGWFAIKDYVVSHSRPGCNVILTGHSLGGAIANVGHVNLLETLVYVADIQCVTFGAPRALIIDNICDRTLELMAESSTHYQHVCDPVPDLMKWTCYDHLNATKVMLDGEKRMPRKHQYWDYHSIKGYIDRLTG